MSWIARSQHVLWLWLHLCMWTILLHASSNAVWKAKLMLSQLVEGTMSALLQIRSNIYTCTCILQGSCKAHELHSMLLMLVPKCQEIVIRPHSGQLVLVWSMPIRLILSCCKTTLRPHILWC